MKKKIDITRYKIKKENIKEKKILIISDTHSQTFSTVNKIIQREHFDFVLVCGDIIHDHQQYDDWEQVLSWLNDITKSLPVYVSFGNHEVFKTNKIFTGKIFQKQNLHVLDDCYEKFDDIYLYGYTPKKKFIHPVNLPDEIEKTIVLCHIPSDVYKTTLIKENFLIAISGHCHGGQWRIFNRGIYSPDQGFFPKYTNGLRFKKKLLITRGLANKSRIPRINNHPEIVILKIN